MDTIRSETQRVRETARGREGEGGGSQGIGTGSATEDCTRLLMRNMLGLKGGVKGANNFKSHTGLCACRSLGRSCNTAETGRLARRKGGLFLLTFNTSVSAVRMTSIYWTFHTRTHAGSMPLGFSSTPMSNTSGPSTPTVCQMRANR